MLLDWVSSSQENPRLSYLEDRAVRPGTAKRYRLVMAHLLKFCREQGLPLVTDTEVDAALVSFLNSLYMRGQQAHYANVVMAGFIHTWPEYNKFGAKKIPRSWRCLKGFRLLCPSRSRRTWPFLIWSAIIFEFARRSKLPMGIMILLGLSSYARPGELLGLRRRDLIEPLLGTTDHWCLLIRPEEVGVRTKTGDFDDSVVMDTEWTSAVMTPVLETLSKGDPSELVFPFSYPCFCKEFKAVMKTLGLEKTGLVPYAWRHSGPSIDRAKGLRSQVETAKRGRWKHFRSTARYEKAGRLGASLKGLDARLLDHGRTCERRLVDIVLGSASGIVPYVKAATT